MHHTEVKKKQFLLREAVGQCFENKKKERHVRKIRRLISHLVQSEGNKHYKTKSVLNTNRFFIIIYCK